MPVNIAGCSLRQCKELQALLWTGKIYLIVILIAKYSIVCMDNETIIGWPQRHPDMKTTNWGNAPNLKPMPGQTTNDSF